MDVKVQLVTQVERGPKTTSVLDLGAEEARDFFLKASSYYNGDLPTYLSLQPILDAVAAKLGRGGYASFKKEWPRNRSDVNYSFVTNKDGRLAWRPYELMHPAIYVALVNLICDSDNWALIQERFKEFQRGRVACCSIPRRSETHNTDQAAQVSSWWQEVEQQSLTCSLEFSHLLHTDVTNCYGSLYTHSIAWALHGLEESKAKKTDYTLLGNQIDREIQAGRYGQTNGISQGSVLMDFLAELVLGYVDLRISAALDDFIDFKIIRYRDDYRIFTNSDVDGERILKVISDELRAVGMRLGAAKTFAAANVVGGSVKPDKIAGLHFQDLGIENAKTMQKQLLRLHQFGMNHPNSGALRRLCGIMHARLVRQTGAVDDREVLVAIATDIAFVSPWTFPAMAGILSHLIAQCDYEQKEFLWLKVRNKMKRIPYNGYLEVWLQRVFAPAHPNIAFASDEPLCRIVNGQDATLWNNDWIQDVDLLAALAVDKIVVADPTTIPEIVQEDEVALFRQNAYEY